MKRLLIVLAAILVLLAGTAFAYRPGIIAIYSDEGATNCNFVDDGGLVQVFIFHLFHDGATLSEFMLDVSLTEWTYLGESHALPLVIGTFVTGISISYQTCLLPPTYLGFASFFGSTIPTCTSIGIVPDPTGIVDEIVVVDCQKGGYYATGRGGVVNPDPSCMCSPPVPVEQTSWGQIKALYR